MIASLIFANGLFSCWADNIFVWLFYSDNLVTQSAAQNAFRNYILYGEANHPIIMLVFNLLGAFLSFGGVFAVWLGRSAENMTNAFWLVFTAEIAESAIFLFGYQATTGLFIFSFEEGVISPIIATIMGIVGIV